MSAPAGQYELVATLWDELITKPGRPPTYIRHRQGDIVRLSATEATRLLAADAVVEISGGSPAPTTVPSPVVSSAAREKAEAQDLQRSYEEALAALPAAAQS